MVRIIDAQNRYAPSAPIFKKLKILRLDDIGKQQMLLLMHKKLNGNLPVLIDCIFPVVEPLRPTRSSHHFQEIFTEKVYRTHTVSWAGPRLWNRIISPMFANHNSVPSSKLIIKDLIKTALLNTY